jgi:putative peptide zinc metalloprotease protein
MALASGVPERLLRMHVKLRPHARFHRHEYRGQPWYVVQNEASGQAHRLSPATYDIVLRFDGRLSLAELHAEAVRRLGEDAPTPEEIIALVGLLYRADLLSADAMPDLEELAQRGAQHRRQRFKQYFLNPLALRMPLLDPDRMLERIASRIAVVPGTAWAAIWLLAVGAGLAVAASNWSTLTDGALDRIFSMGNLVILWLVYPVVKLLHELAHGVAIRRFGGQVHEMGVMFLVFVPVPYVEASAATAFPSKPARMLVSAAGMLMELFLAGLALIAWTMLEPGALRAVCFNVALIAGVSTLLFNGNPLLRFDGYYVLADLVEIPNLGQRSTAYLAYLAQRYLFGLREAASPATSPGEARWLFGYGVASSLYRPFVIVAIILLVATKFFFVGVALALWGAYTMVLRPIAAGALFVARSPQLASRRRQAVTTAGAVLAALGIVLFVLPAPQWTRTEGVVWVPEHSQIRAQTACWVRKVVAPVGAPVRAGDLLVECEDVELGTKVKVLEHQLAELRARDLAYFVESRLHLDVVREEIVNAEAQLADARRRLAGLLLRSPADGIFVVPQPADAPGRYLQRGEVLGYVLEPGPATVRVVVDQADVDLVRGATRAVGVKPADRIADTLNAHVVREVPGASDRLPSSALGVPGGGIFGVDPRAAPDGKDEAPKSAVPVFQFDLEVPAEAALHRLGMRVFVRFDHRPAPLARQWYRSTRRMLLRLFQV